MNINEILAKVDALKREYARNALAVFNDPASAFGTAAARYVNESLPTHADVQDAMSVMPGMGDALSGKINALASPGIFGGGGAKTADLAALANAKQMELLGHPREAIWKQTGWFKGPEGAWKFEIPDETAQFKGFTTGEGLAIDRTKSAPNVLAHNQLYAAYPGLEDIQINVKKLPEWLSAAHRASYDMNKKIGVRSSTDEYARSGLLHEMQHGVQKQEDFAKGGTEWTSHGQIVNQNIPEHYRDVQTARALQAAKALGLDLNQQAKLVGASPKAIELAKQFKSDDLDSVLKSAVGLRNVDPYDAYRRLAGEAEARAVQARRDMGPAERQQTPPWQSYDIPWDQLFVVR